MKHRIGSALNVLLILLLLQTSANSEPLSKTSSDTTVVSTGQILQQTVTTLASEIRSSISDRKFTRLAVMPFTSLRGEENDLGLYISDRLTSELSVSGDNLQLVERSQINQALSEMRLGETGLLSEETIQKTGQALGADAVIIGTIVELGTEVDINLRMFSVSTLKILGMASQLIEKDEVIESLLQLSIPPSGNVIDSESTSNNTNADSIFFYEDFTGIEEGLIPDQWIGGSTLAVKSSDLNRRTNVLANFKKGNHNVTVPDIPFPDNWRFDIEFFYTTDRYFFNPFVLKIGDVKASFYRHQSFLNDINAHKPAPKGNQINLVSVVKSGSVIKLFVNTERIKMIRMESFESPTGLSISYTGDFSVFRLKGTKLP